VPSAKPGDTEKSCTLCKEVKPLSEFHRQRRNPDGLMGWCKVCSCARANKWRHNNLEKATASAKRYRLESPNYHRKSALNRGYGMALEDYASILAAQHGKCAICGSAESDSGKRFLCVDHIADTLKVRGILCARCNSALGLMGHDVSILATAIEYLNRPIVFEGTKVPRGIHRSKAA